jgi:hypothetical protein
MGNLNVRAYFIVVLFAIGLTIFAILGIQNNWGIFRQPSLSRSLNTDARNVDAFEAGALDVAGVDLFLTVLPPNNGEEVRELSVRVGDANMFLRDDNADSEIVTACLDRIQAFIGADGDYSEVHEFLNEPVCVDIVPEDFTAEQTDFGNGFVIDNYAAFGIPNEDFQELKIADSDIVSLNFWYPFDSFTLPVELIVYYSVILDDGSFVNGTIQPLLQWDLQTNGKRLWDIRLSSESVLDRSLNEAGEMSEFMMERVTFVFERPLLYRLVFPFFMIGMVLLIGLVPLLGDRDTLVDICAAMLFGIFGLKGILNPGDAMGQTLLDIALIGLYVVLAFAAFLFFLNKVFMRSQPTEQTT